MNVDASPSRPQENDVTSVLWPAELEVMLRLGHWATPDHLLSEALESLLSAHPELRIDVAIDLFQHQSVSLARAAEIAGTDRWTFGDMLQQRSIPLVIEVSDSATMDDTLRLFSGREA